MYSAHHELESDISIISIITLIIITITIIIIIITFVIVVVVVMVAVVVIHTLIFINNGIAGLHTSAWVICWSRRCGAAVCWP